MNPGASDVPKIAPVYLVWQGEMLLAAPIEEVWPHVLNYPSWQNYPRLQHVSGRPGEEGEVVLLMKEEKGFTFPPYYARTIKLEPPHRVIWKTYPQVAQEINFFGIVDFTLAEAQDKTRFRYDMLYEFLVPHRTEDELKAFHTQQDENFQALFSVTLPKLRSLVEKNARGLDARQ